MSCLRWVLALLLLLPALGDVGSWSEAPGHVELEATTGFRSEAGCHYRLPRPVLSYDVIP